MFMFNSEFNLMSIQNQTLQYSKRLNCSDNSIHVCILAFLVVTSQADLALNLRVSVCSRELYMKKTFNFI